MKYLDLCRQYFWRDYNLIMFFQRTLSCFITKITLWRTICSFDAWISKTTWWNSYILLISCDPFHWRFLLITICESHMKIIVIEFFFERHRLQFNKKELRQRFFPLTFVKFFRKILSRTTFSKWFYFRGWPCAALSKQKLSNLAH